MGDDEWQPPTDAELKVIQARRERSDQISKRMAEYLLKGYKMLGTCCPICTTILLRDKEGHDYCIACREVDAECAKDKPECNDEAAMSQVREQSFLGQPSSRDVASTQRVSTSTVDEMDSLNASDQPVVSHSSTVNIPLCTRNDVPMPLAHSSRVVQDKLQWATAELSNSRSVEESVRLCQLIKASADALNSLQHLWTERHT